MLYIHGVDALGRTKEERRGFTGISEKKTKICNILVFSEIRIE